MSGNTEEVSEIIKDELEKHNVWVEVYYVDLFVKSTPPNINSYDKVFIGTYTWDFGDVPDEMIDFINEIGVIDIPVHVFGTGETQFGDDKYCLAVDLIAKKYNTNDILKIEQSPRGRQEKRVRQWVKSLLNI